MFGAAIAEFVSTQSGDSAQFIGKALALIIGSVRGREPMRLYAIRIDNWFGPKWMHFAGKFTAGKHAAIGVHKTQLHVPPFIPHRWWSSGCLRGRTMKRQWSRLRCTWSVRVKKLFHDE